MKKRIDNIGSTIESGVHQKNRFCRPIHPFRTAGEILVRLTHLQIAQTVLQIKIDKREEFTHNKSIRAILR